MRSHLNDGEMNRGPYLHGVLNPHMVHHDGMGMPHPVFAHGAGHGDPHHMGFGVHPNTAQDAIKDSDTYHHIYRDYYKDRSDQKSFQDPQSLYEHPKNEYPTHIDQ